MPFLRRIDQEKAKKTRKKSLPIIYFLFAYKHRHIYWVHVRWFQSKIFHARFHPNQYQNQFNDDVSYKVQTLLYEQIKESSVKRKKRNKRNHQKKRRKQQTVRCVKSKDMSTLNISMAHCSCLYDCRWECRPYLSFHRFHSVALSPYAFACVLACNVIKVHN